VLVDGKTVQWASTDPLNTFDVFFWDQSNKFTVPLGQILANQGPTKFTYRRVKAEQANAISAKFDPKKTKGFPVVNALNKNSVTLAKQAGFAVVYARDTLSQNGTSQVLGDAQDFVDEGKAILIDPDAIHVQTSKPGYPLSNATLLAEVVAHETGHRFSRQQPLRQSCLPCTFIPFSQLSSLNSGQFTLKGTGSSTVYVQLNQYQVPSLKLPHIGDHLPVGRLNTMATKV
jgi:hypothetical protein